MGFRIVIPARHASSRLPGKPLLDIAGRPVEAIPAGGGVSFIDEIRLNPAGTAAGAPDTSLSPPTAPQTAAASARKPLV